MQPPGPRGGELDEVGQRPRAALLREPDEPNEDLRSRHRVGQSAVARLGGHAEEVRERGEPDAAEPVAEEPPREPHRVDDRRRDPAARQVLDLPVEEGEVEPRVVGDDRRIAREGEESPDREPRRRGSADGRRPDARQPGHRLRGSAPRDRRASRRCPPGRGRARAGLRSRRSARRTARGPSSRGRRRRSARTRAARLPRQGARDRPRSRARRAVRRP